MPAESLSAFKAQLLEDFMVDNYQNISTNDLVFVAFGKNDPEWVDPANDVVDQLNYKTHYKCLGASQIEAKRTVAPMYSVFYVTTKWNQKSKVYECRIGRYDGAHSPDIMRLSGYGRSGEIRRSFFKWKFSPGGGWVS